MEKEKKVLGLLGLATRAGKISFGMDSVKETIQKRKAKLVMIAQDASDKSKKQVEEEAIKQKIPIRYISTMEILSNAIGKQNKMVISIQDIHFAEEIIKIIDGGDIIG